MDIIHYIYLLQTKHSIDKKEQVYKIGRTVQTNYKRILQYPNQTIVLHQTICTDSVYYEYQIIKLFKEKYIQICEYGKEYFKGDCNDMINDIHTLIKLPRLQNVVIENVKQENDQDFIDKYNDDILSIIEQNKTEMISIINNTKKEIIETIVNKDSRFNCEKCNYSTLIKQNFEKHFLSKKHTSNIINENCIECKICHKKYNSTSGLWSHNQICKEIKTEKIDENNELREMIKQLIIKQDGLILKQDGMENRIIQLLKNQPVPIINM